MCSQQGTIAPWVKHGLSAFPREDVSLNPGDAVILLDETIAKREECEWVEKQSQAVGEGTKIGPANLIILITLRIRVGFNNNNMFEYNNNGMKNEEFEASVSCGAIYSHFEEIKN